MPYVAHLLAVCSLVLEDTSPGRDFAQMEAEAIAAVLHDAVEDCGGVAVLELIDARFGPAVAGLVEDCTDADAIPKPPWAERKVAHLTHLESVSESALRVTAADKLHNVRCVIAEVDREGPEVAFSRFKGGHAGTFWYYESMSALLMRRLPGSVSVRLLADAVAQLPTPGDGFDPNHPLSS